MVMKLRQHAEERIEKGTAPFTRGHPTGRTALTLLHRLASTPETAGDALKLLHELQVHQVELDLQHEQAELDLHQLSEDLKRFADLFELAPFGYLTLDAEGLVTGANRIATDWLAAKNGEAEECEGQRIEDLLAPESRSAIRGLFAGLRKGEGEGEGEGGGEGRQSCAVQSRAGASAQAIATALPGGGRVSMAFVPAEPGSGHPSPRQAST